VLTCPINRGKVRSRDCQNQTRGLDKNLWNRRFTDCIYFSVHETADVEHSDAKRSILTNNCTNEETQKQVLDSVEKSTKAMWTFLDGVYENYVNWNKFGETGFN